MILMKIYDFEHHFYAKELIEHLSTRNEYPYANEKRDICISEGMTTANSYLSSWLRPGKNVLDDLLDIGEDRISIMDTTGLSCGIISTSDVIELLPRDEAVRMARITNDRVAEACRKYPDRFLGSFCLPTPYVEESLEEMERAVNELGLKYWHTHSCYGDIHLYEERFEPLFAKLSEMDVPFAIHPTYTSDKYLLDMGVALSTAAYGFATDVMKTTAMLVVGGLFDRYQNLKMIMGHMGEFYPYIIDRMDHVIDIFRGEDTAIKSKKAVSEYFRNGNIFISTSGIFNPDVVLFAIKTFGIDCVLYGSDYPYENLRKSIQFVDSLPISNEDKEKIFYKNAEKYIL